MSNHKTIPMLVWADVDEGIAGMVAYLNTIPGVRTEASCQGTIGEGGPNPYRAQVLTIWPPEQEARLLSEFDMHETNRGGCWGYLHPRDGWTPPASATTRPDEARVGKLSMFTTCFYCGRHRDAHVNNRCPPEDATSPAQADASSEGAEHVSVYGYGESCGACGGSTICKTDCRLAKESPPTESARATHAVNDVWRSMDSAPRDGSNVIVAFHTVADGLVVSLAWYRDEKDIEEMKLCGSDADETDIGWWRYRSSVTQEMIQPQAWRPLNFESIEAAAQPQVGV